MIGLSRERHRIYRRTKCEGTLWCEYCWAPVAPDHHQASTEVLVLCQVCRFILDGKFDVNEEEES